jgi:phosphotransferase system HPr (HPr) family protein
VVLRRPATRQVIVAHPNGLHVRPSTAIVKTVRQFESQVEIRYDGHEAVAREVLQILSLRVPQGAEITLAAEGFDAEKVLEALVRLFADDFGMSRQ